MITLAGLIALNRENELRLHFRGARNLGLSKEKIEDLITLLDISKEKMN
jgi:alkylhydroperoxidase/carboxymuconolactone decarboxylase family protein YurZ